MIVLSYPELCGVLALLAVAVVLLIDLFTPRGGDY